MILKNFSLVFALTYVVVSETEIPIIFLEKTKKVVIPGTKYKPWKRVKGIKIWTAKHV
jgi:hypothetical protein